MTRADRPVRIVCARAEMEGRERASARGRAAGRRLLSFARVILQIVIEFETVPVVHSTSFVKEMNGPRNAFFRGGHVNSFAASTAGTKRKLIGASIVPYAPNNRLFA